MQTLSLLCAALGGIALLGMTASAAELKAGDAAVILRHRALGPIIPGEPYLQLLTLVPENDVRLLL